MTPSPDDDPAPVDGQPRADAAFLPLTLLAISFLITLIWQLTNVSNQRATFQSTLSRQEEMVKQSRQVQSNLEKLVLDVLELRRGGDADAEALVQKYGIQQQSGPGQVPLK